MDPDEIQAIINQTIGGATPSAGAGPAVSGAPMGAMTNEEWYAFVAKHGGLKGAIPINPTIKTTNALTGVAVQEPNPDPQYRYVFGDGTYIIGQGIRTPGTATGQGNQLGVNITNPGTAYKADAAAEAKTAANARYYDLNTTARYLPSPGATGSEDLASPGAPGGMPPGYEANPNYDPKTSALDLAYKQAQIDALNRGPIGHDPATAARLAWEQQWEPQKFALEQQAKKEAAVAAYKQFVEQQAAENARNRLTNTTQFTNNLLDTWAKAAPSAMIPGQQQFLGFEPGGPMEQLVRMGGGRYDPNLYRPAPVSIDPAAAWAQAQGLISNGR